MTDILQAGDLGSVGHQDVTQNQYREQINAINDAVRQLGGKAHVNPGDTDINDPLNLPYVLYVNADIGNDTIVFGDYSTRVDDDDTETNTIMRRIRQQQLESGYTEARPFKTLNRAILEAGILTSRDYHTDCSFELTRVTIVVSGRQVVYNDEGLATGDDYWSDPWTDGYEPTPEDLLKFNPREGGLILPRGCSVVSLDLRKSIITPNFVPSPVDRNGDESNQRAILLTTGQSYLYGFTFMDNPGFPRSHHLLTTFMPASKTELDNFYGKIRDKLGNDIPLGAYLETDVNEYQIVGPQPANPDTTVDTVASASPYLYNCSIRSSLGLCGVDYRGSKTSGFKSMVMAQYTGVSLQTDYRAWEKYTNAANQWQPVENYQEVIDNDPNHVRMKPSWAHYHIKATDNAVIQEVSVFAIGQNVHHWVERGGEITITNSNSNFGGCAALAEGYHDTAQPQDKPWVPVAISRALDPFAKSQSVRWIYLGTLSEADGANPDNTQELILEEGLSPSTAEGTQPDVLYQDNYTLKEGDYIWVRNIYGLDYRATLTETPWSPGAPDRITIREPLETQEGDKPGTDKTFPSLPGSEVYVRRFVDRRTVEERTYELLVDGNNLGKRNPPKDYVIRDVPGNWNDDYLTSIQFTRPDDRDCGYKRLELRNAIERPNEANFSSTKYYRKGDVVLRNGLHYQATRDHYGADFGDFNMCNWQENYKHMPEDYAPEGSAINSHPVILFDGDTDDQEQSRNCGFSLDTPVVKAQIESATDWKGLAYYMIGADIVGHTLDPQGYDTREESIGTQSEIEFRRPSQIRLFGHAYEWTGYGSYSTALPKYQKDLSGANQWTFYKTNYMGGRCYISGFNQEGLLVTNRGLEDLETGAKLSFADFGAPDQDFDVPEENNIDVPEYNTAQIRDEGIIALAAWGDRRPEPPASDTKAEWNIAINSSAKAVTPPFLTLWKNENNLVQAPPAGVSAIVIHVIPDGAEAWAKNNLSVPYGVPKDEYTRYNDSLSVNETAKTITEAMELASKIFVPAGASIVISVHGDITEPEKGPLQLANSYARVIVATAEGLGRPARINVDQSVTENALKRFSELSYDYSFSAGVIFADTELICDCRNNRETTLTMNGGFGMGIFGNIIRLRNTNGVSLCDASFGEKTTIDCYPPKESSAAFEWKVIRESGASDGDYINVIGPSATPSSKTGSGLTGHGIDIAINFNAPGYGDSGQPQIVWSYENKGAGQPLLSFLACGGRGGTRAGGRVAPIVIFDFKNTNWNLGDWIGNAYVRAANYFGRHFRVNQSYDRMNINAATKGTITQLKLRRGCEIDIHDPDDWQCGPFAVYPLWEQAVGGDLLLIADNKTNAYIYADDENWMFDSGRNVD